MTAVVPLATAGAPIPAGRGRWRLLAYHRQFDTAAPIAIAELIQARSRQLTQKWNQPAQLTFTLDGHSPSAGLLLELATDILAVRWDENQGADIPMFRGLIDHSEDQVSEQAHTVNFTCHDYSAMLDRRQLTTPYIVANVDQETIASQLVAYGSTTVTSSSGVSFRPGNFLPMVITRVNPDGTQRIPYSGQVRDRTYQPGQNIGDAMRNLAAVINGFDFDVDPQGPSSPYDFFRLFYPYQGVARSDVALVYGINVSTLTRTVTSQDYANYVRVIGNKASASASAPQLFSEAWNTDSNNVTVNPVGLWMLSENASDVSIQSTLDERAQGDLAYDGVVTPAYTLTLRPDWYTLGCLNMCDTVPLVVQSGRLNVNTSVRVVGLEWTINDNGGEDVKVTIGRPTPDLSRHLAASARDIDALARR